MKILVTGGAGYLGSSLVPLLLDAGHAVRVLDRLDHGGRSLLHSWPHADFSFMKGDVRDSDAVAAALDGVEAVVHLAAIVGDPACATQPEEAKSINLEASISLLDACVARGVKRFLSASTCSNYGKMAEGDGFVDEDSELRPVSLYAETKVGMERAVLDTDRTQGLCATSMRFATLFGVSPRMRFDLTVNEFTLELVRTKKLVVYGEQFWRPYVHVRDAARAIRMLLEAPEDVVAGQVFNIGATAQNYRKQDLIEMILPHAPGATIERVDKQEDPRDYRVRFERIADRIGFKPESSVEKGIEEIAQMTADELLLDFASPEFKNVA